MQNLISWPALSALLLLALNVRLIFPSLSVLLPEIIETADISAATAGYITTLPMLCLGLFGPVASICARRFGIERTLVIALTVLTAGTATRGMSGLSGLFIGTLLAGASIAVCNVLLPVLVKRDFASHAALITGLYVTAMNLGSAAAAGMTVPLVQSWDASWSTGLSVWAIPPAVALIVWLPRLKHKRQLRTQSSRSTNIVKSPLAWHVTVYMGLQSTMAFIVLGWMAPILHSRGLDPTAAGMVASACIVANLAGNLFAPALIRNSADQRLASIFLPLGCGLSLIFLLFATPDRVWPLALLIGFTQGATFATALTLIVLRSPDTGTATALSGMAQSVGYTIGAMASLIVGLIYDQSGSFTQIAWLLSIVVVGTTITGWSAGQNRLVSASSIAAVASEHNL